MSVNFGLIVDSILISAKESVDAFGAGDNGLGYNKIIELIEKMQDFIVALSNIGSSDEDLKKYIMKLNSILMDINQALINRDSILVSDIIEFELIPVIEIFKQ